VASVVYLPLIFTLRQEERGRVMPRLIYDMEQARAILTAEEGGALWTASLIDSGLTREMLAELTKLFRDGSVNTGKPTADFFLTYAHPGVITLAEEDE
jgi:hypothetical protein